MGERVDAIDRRLVDLLVADARTPVAELARRVGLSRTAALARVRRLEDRGVIRGYRAEVALEAAGTHDARVGIAVRTKDVRVYVRRLAAFPELVEVEAVAGTFDLLAHFTASSAARLDEILDGIGAWRDTERTTTFVILRTYRATDV